MLKQKSDKAQLKCFGVCFLSDRHIKYNWKIKLDLQNISQKRIYSKNLALKFHTAELPNTRTTKRFGLTSSFAKLTFRKFFRMGVYGVYASVIPLMTGRFSGFLIEQDNDLHSNMNSLSYDNLFIIFWIKVCIKKLKN